MCSCEGRSGSSQHAALVTLRTEAGQTLIEMVVAMALLATTVALFATAFATGIFSTRDGQLKDVAVALADSAIDNARAVTPASSLLSGVCQTNGVGCWVTNPPLTIDLSSTLNPLEQSQTSETLDNTKFTVTTFTGTCYLQVTGDCTTTTNSKTMIRVIAEVAWNVSSGCGCHYIASSLISNAPDAISETISVPAAPTQTAPIPGSDQITVNWIDVAEGSDGGSNITGYDVYGGTSSGGEGSSPVCTASGSSVTSCKVTGLSGGNSYYFTVEAVNSVGNSAPSNEEGPVSLAAVPGAPTQTAATPGAGQVTVNWTVDTSTGGSPITGYDVYDGTGSSDDVSYTSPVCTASGASTTSCTVTGLSNGTLYYFTVEAENAVGSSGSSNPESATPVTTPGPPTQLNPTAGVGEVRISWTAPQSDGGSAITGYAVYFGSRSGEENYGTAVCTAGANATSCTVTGLISGTYYFTVEAVNAEGNSTASNEESSGPTRGRY